MLVDAAAPTRPRATPAGALLALLLGAAVVLLARWGPDWPAQEFRAWSAAHDGLTMLTIRWYGGQPLTGYSVAYPFFAATLGAGATGLLATVAGAWAAAPLAPAGRWRARYFQVAVAVGLTQNLLIGQVPFLLGVAFGLLAVRALSSRAHPVWVAAAALGCSLASPLAGAFLLLAVPALALLYGWRRTALLGAAVVGVAVPTLIGGAGGPFPCQWEALAGIAVFQLAVLLTADRANRALRRFAWCYLLVAVVVFAVPNPVGGNISRLGKLIALPLACHALISVARPARRRAVAAVLLAVAWPAVPFVTSIARGASDPSQNQAYYTGLVRFLHTQPTGGRLEIPFTREHWEAMWVARSYPIARGWERQSDLQYNQVLYHPISATAYRSWLADNAVSLVALPRVAIDYGGKAEAALLAHPPGYLRPLWHDPNWQVWRVVGARPLVTGAARATDLDPASVTLRFPTAGTAVIRMHANRLWYVAGGAACLDAGTDGWLEVVAERPGTVRLSTGITRRLVTGSEACGR